LFGNDFVVDGEITGWTSPGTGSPTGYGPIEITDRIAEHSLPPDMDGTTTTRVVMYNAGLGVTLTLTPPFTLAFISSA